MTTWKTVHGDRQPAVLDTTSSSFVVYERKNIRQETVTDMDGTQRTEWVYEEREYTKDEYNMMLSPAIQGVQQVLSEIQLAVDSL